MTQVAFPSPALAPTPPARPRPRPRTLLVLAVVVVVHVLALIDTEFSLHTLARGWRGVLDFLSQAPPPDISWTDVVAPGVQACLTTFYIGLLGTTLSVPFAAGLAVLGSRSADRSSTTST